MKKLLVISGPSGVGKGTIVKELMKRNGCVLSISCTTRKPRKGEQEGISYFFITKEQFLNTLEKGGFLEFSKHFENYYGTPRAFVESQLKEHDVILEIEVDGALQVKKSHPEAELIMVTPPSVEELKARLIGRGSETEESIAKRLARMDYELSKIPEYDYVVVNDVLDNAVKEIEKIINS